MRKIGLNILFFIFIISCEKEQNLQFTEYNFLWNQGALVEINILKADSSSSIGRSINEMVDKHIASVLNLDDENNNTKLTETIDTFSNNYMAFKDELEDESFRWEASFEGEIMSQSPSLVSLVISSYLNTGGAHGSLNISFLNFDITSGERLSTSLIISDIEAFTQVAEIYFEKEIEEIQTDTSSNYFFGKKFQLPENIGFNDEGVVLLYNVYEIASFDDGMIEFTIPYKDVEDFLSDITLDLL